MKARGWCRDSRNGNRTAGHNMDKGWTDESRMRGRRHEGMCGSEPWSFARRCAIKIALISVFLVGTLPEHKLRSKIRNETVKVSTGAGIKRSSRPAQPCKQWQCVCPTGGCKQVMIARRTIRGGESMGRSFRVECRRRMNCSLFRDWSAWSPLPGITIRKDKPGHLHPIR